jgi:hypothetical protein
MPFVHDQTEIEWPEDDSEPEPPRADQFVYIPPPEFGGAREPVRFSVVPPDLSLEPNEPHRPAEREPPAQTEPPGRSILDRLLGRLRLPAAQQRSQGAYQEERKRQERAQDQRRLQLFAVMVPALREIGGRRAYCRYDGGNDEGFAWLDSIEMRDGTRINADSVAQRLGDIQVQDKLCAANIMKRAHGVSDREQLKDFVRYWLCSEWASMLLGNSFGTGEYSMYGAFIVDLEACTVNDDPRADPVVENIRIAT